MDKMTADKFLNKSMSRFFEAINHGDVADNQRIPALLSVSSFVDLVTSQIGAGPPMIPLGTQLPTTAVIKCPNCAYDIAGNFQ